eukprot:4467783-Pyramimonas_sp.AAC.1
MSPSFPVLTRCECARSPPGSDARIALIMSTVPLPSGCNNPVLMVSHRHGAAIASSAASDPAAPAASFDPPTWQGQEGWDRCCQSYHISLPPTSSHREHCGASMLLQSRVPSVLCTVSVGVTVDKPVSVFAASCVASRGQTNGVGAAA